MGYILTNSNTAYKLVAEQKITSAVTAVTFDLSANPITKDDDYILVSTITQNYSQSTTYNLFANGNTTPTNYYTQNLNADSTTVSGFRSNSSIFCVTGGTSNYPTYTVSKIKLTNSGYVVSQNDSNMNYAYSSSVMKIDKNYITSTFTTSSITSLTISTTFSNAIGIGSRFQLYKCVATKVADTTVTGSAVTSVDFTGLSIDKGSEYMLVSDANNAAASGTSYNILANNNTTLTNYYHQNIRASGTYIEVIRLNSSGIYGALTNLKTSGLTNIKLTNNGYFVYQSNSVRFYGGSTVELHNIEGTSTFTSTSITQLTVSAETALGIGIGSRFQLYKLK